jgi:hypothetical protein
MDSKKTVYRARLRDNSQLKSQTKKKRGTRQNHKRLPYISINVYRTSLDHLLLGMDADIDRMSTAPSIKPFSEKSKIDFWIVAISKMNRGRPPGAI